MTELCRHCNLAATIAEYGYDERTKPSKPIARVNITYTNPPDANEHTYFGFWVCTTSTSITDPPDAAKFEHRANMRWETGRTDVDIWEDRPKQGDPTQRFWIRAVVCDEFYSGPPTNSSLATYVDITAAGTPVNLNESGPCGACCGSLRAYIENHLDPDGDLDPGDSAADIVRHFDGVFALEGGSRITAEQMQAYLNNLDRAQP